jgi:hypothetical protein
VKTSASIWFASQPEADDEHAGEVGVPRVAGERAPQDVDPLPVVPMPQPVVCASAHDAVDVAEVLERVALECSATCFATVAEQFTVDRMPM